MGIYAIIVSFKTSINLLILGGNAISVLTIGLSFGGRSCMIDVENPDSDIKTALRLDLFN